jgi:hypothetical protein
MGVLASRAKANEPPCSIRIFLFSAASALLRVSALIMAAGYVYLSTSSMLVSPSKMLRKPS